jgi:hypothetical protein
MSLQMAPVPRGRHDAHVIEADLCEERKAVVIPVDADFHCKDEITGKD